MGAWGVGGFRLHRGLVASPPGKLPRTLRAWARENFPNTGAQQGCWRFQDTQGCHRTGVCACVCVMGTQLRHQRTHRSVQLDLHPTRPNEMVHSKTQGDTLRHPHTALQSPPPAPDTSLHQPHTDPMLTCPHSPIHNAAITHRNNRYEASACFSCIHTDAPRYKTPLLHLSTHTPIIPTHT